jgi:hypothetical protein
VPESKYFTVAYNFLDWDFEPDSSGNSSVPRGAPCSRHQWHSSSRLAHLEVSRGLLSQDRHLGRDGWETGTAHALCASSSAWLLRLKNVPRNRK